MNDWIQGSFLEPRGPRIRSSHPMAKWLAIGPAVDNKLKKIAISGGAPVTLTDAAPYGSLSWGADDTIVYGQQQKGIMRISANGGTPEVIVKAEKGQTSYIRKFCRMESLFCSPRDLSMLLVK